MFSNENDLFCCVFYFSYIRDTQYIPVVEEQHQHCDGVVHGDSENHSMNFKFINFYLNKNICHLKSMLVEYLYTHTQTTSTIL